MFKDVSLYFIAKNSYTNKYMSLLVVVTIVVNTKRRNFSVIYVDGSIISNNIIRSSRFEQTLYSENRKETLIT